MTDTNDDAPVVHFFSVADASGRVIRIGYVPFEDWIPMQAANAGEQAVTGKLDAATQWVSGGLAAPRPDNPAVLAGTSLSSLPVPCTIYIDDAAYPCTDDHADLTLTVPKTYRIRVEAFPLKDAEFEVTIT